MDGAHLKGDFKGTILHAIAMDGNNQILPLAHGICKKDSGLTWTWFLEKLYECVGDCQELTFVTDRADAIRVGIENVFLYAHHGLCAFYLLGNIVHRFGNNDKTKVLFWRLVKAYKRNVFEELCAESMNDLSVDARKMPITPLLEFFRRLSQEWWKRSTVLTEWAEKVVSKNEECTTGWSVSGVSDAIYQVHDFKHGGIVDLMQETYAYKMETYRSTYEEPVYPLPESFDWEIPAEMKVVKPLIMDTRQAGRPRNINCIPSQGEEPIVKRCSRCDSTTHNAATCPTLVPKKQKRLQKVVQHLVVTQKGKGKGQKGLRRC
ncbi:unnamed protein product [Lactuca saligna]|uniref:MULE transposase domain-containing protein n=1 Tax=Lactuca saligna TaxID=75948 RepID=A0AA36EJF2_LACSI|nr:unnamed protein product [Lactuca saligna]